MCGALPLQTAWYSTLSIVYRIAYLACLRTSLRLSRLPGLNFRRLLHSPNQPSSRHSYELDMYAGPERPSAVYIEHSSYAVDKHTGCSPPALITTAETISQYRSFGFRFLLYTIFPRVYYWYLYPAAPTAPPRLVKGEPP